VGKIYSQSRQRGRDLQEHHILFEATCYFVESVVNNVSQTYLPGGRRQPGMVVASDPATVAAILDQQEAIFRMLLELHYGDPVMITHLAKLMECFSRLIGLRKTLAVLAIQKVRLLISGICCGISCSIHYCSLGSAKGRIQDFQQLADERQQRKAYL